MQRAIEGLARVMALLGGAVLTALILLTCLSVLGRGGNTFAHSEFLHSIAPALSARLIASGIGPVAGDFEIVEAGIAFTIFAFLPWCQIRQGHATVDIFTSFLSLRANRVILAFWELVAAVAIALIAWRLYDGMLGKIRNGETTFLLQFPVWWAYLASFVAACIAALVAAYTAGVRILGLISGHEILPRSGGASH